MKREVPDHIFEKLIGALICESAAALLAQRTRAVELNAGDHFGRVVTWLWDTDASSDDVVAYVADLVAQVRYHADGADPTITLDDILSAIRRSTSFMAPPEAAALLACLKADVPAYL